jgi:hypothetical protein
VGGKLMAEKAAIQTYCFRPSLFLLMNLTVCSANIPLIHPSGKVGITLLINYHGQIDAAKQLRTSPQADSSANPSNTQGCDGTGSIKANNCAANLALDVFAEDDEIEGNGFPREKRSHVSMSQYGELSRNYCHELI